MMQRVGGVRFPQKKSKMTTILMVGLIALVVLGTIMYVLTLWKRSKRDKTPWLIVPRGDGTFKVIEKENVESFQPNINSGPDLIGDGFSQRTLYVRKHMSLLEQSLAGYNFFEKGECDDSKCRTMDLTKHEDALWFLNQFHKEVTDVSRDRVEKVDGVKLLFDIATVIDLDPLTIRVRDSREASENEYMDLLVGYGKGHLPLATGYQWLLYLRKHEGKPLPRPDEDQVYAIGGSM